MKKKNHIKKLSVVLNTTGLGVFLVVGLSGCDGVGNNDECKQYSNVSKQYMQECEDKRNRTHSSGSSHATTGFFGSGSSSHSESVGG